MSTSIGNCTQAGVGSAHAVVQEDRDDTVRVLLEKGAVAEEEGSSSDT